MKGTTTSYNPELKEVLIKGRKIDYRWIHLLGLSSIQLSNNVSVWLGSSGVRFAVLDADVKDLLDWIGSWKQLSISVEWTPISCTTQNPGPTTPANGPTASLRISSWFLSAVIGPVGTVQFFKELPHKPSQNTTQRPVRDDCLFPFSFPKRQWCHILHPFI